MEQDDGRSPLSGSGSQASPGAAEASPPSVSIPNAGDWVIYSNYGRGVRQVAKVTPKLVKFDGPSRPHQCERSQVIAFAADKETAERLKQSIDGIEGEFVRRRNAANADYYARVKAAREAADNQIARLLASGIEAATAGETHK